MRGEEQGIEISVRAKNWINRPIIAYVVAEIAHRRFEERRDPNCVNAQPCNVIEPLRYSREIAGPIIIRIEKASRINLVNDCSTPPF